MLILQTLYIKAINFGSLIKAFQLYGFLMDFIKTIINLQMMQKSVLTYDLIMEVANREESVRIK